MKFTKDLVTKEQMIKEKDLKNNEAVIIRKADKKNHICYNEHC